MAVQGFGNGPDHEEAPEIAAERERLHRQCGDMFEKYGSVRHPEWLRAKRELDDFRDIHDWEYNPD